MKLFSLVAAFLVSFGAMAQQSQSQIVLNVEREDFNPIDKASWRLMVGTASLDTKEGNVSRSGNGLGFTAEKIMSERFTLGAHLANVSTSVTDRHFDGTQSEYKQSINMLDAYGKYAFVNYSINKWNQIQVSGLGGALAADKHATQLIYGLAASYNYDNVIGFELSTKLNFDAEASTSANLIGYF